MKITHMLILGSLFTAFSAQAVEIKSARLDASKENIIVSVVHGGGCGDHSYELVLQGCAESMPVQCQATIKHMTNDFCEAMISREAKFSLKKYKLTDRYYQSGSLTIKGDSGTKATVILPGGATTNTVKAIRCSTHTGSDLVVTDKKVTLVTRDNQVAEFKIVDVKFRSIETYPSIDQMTYKLSDGRSLQLEFTSGSKTGNGQFIRFDGSYSPEFVCNK